jgi:glucokinase
LFIKIYSEAVANFTTQHVATGGMYLIGGITNSIFPKIQGSDMFATFKKNHPEVESLVKDVPIMVCKVVELGMRGAFFIARRILSQQ